MKSHPLQARLPPSRLAISTHQPHILPVQNPSNPHGTLPRAPSSDPARPRRLTRIPYQIQDKKGCLATSLCVRHCVRLRSLGTRSGRTTPTSMVAYPHSSLYSPTWGIIPRPPSTGPTMKTISIKLLSPHPSNRAIVKDDEYHSLVESIRTLGIQTPLIVRPRPGATAPKGYEIIGGHRRYTAAKEAGVKDVPCNIVELSDTEALVRLAVDNAHRKDLSGMEWYKLCKALRDEGADRKTIAGIMGKSAEWVKDIFRISGLDPAIKKKATKEGWTLGRLRAEAKGKPGATAPDPQAARTPLDMKKDRLTNLLDLTISDDDHAFLAEQGKTVQEVWDLAIDVLKAEVKRTKKVGGGAGKAASKKR